MNREAPLAVLVARLEHELESVRLNLPRSESDPFTLAEIALSRAFVLLEQIRNHSDLGGRR